MVAALLLAVALGGPPTAKTIVAEVVANIQKTAKLRHERGLTGTKREVTTDVAKIPEQVVETKMFRLEASTTGLPQRLVQHDGAAIRGAASEPPEYDLDTLVAAMQEHYTIVMASPEPIDDHYVIAFKPKNPNRPAPDQKGVVINHMSGVAYIDKDLKFVRHLYAWLEDGFSQKFIGKVQEANAQLDQELLEGMPVPSKTVFTVRYSRSLGINVLGLTPGVNQRTTIEYSYDPLPALPPAPTPAPSP